VRRPEIELSVVVPVYGCASCLKELHRRLTAVLTQLVADYELVFVDDRAPDNAWPVLVELGAADQRVRAFRLSRNFGQHKAITAGLAASRGRWVVVMDCDLQDPPEQIPRLYEAAVAGHDVVFGRRATRSHSPLRQLAARIYFRLMNTFTRSEIDGSFGTFSILSAKVVDAYLKMGERDRHYLFILYWLGFDHAVVDYDHAERSIGDSSYGLGSLVRHAIDGVFFQTTVLLRWIVYLGFLLSAAGAGLAVYFVIAKLTDAAYPGWTSLAVFTLVIGGFMIVSTGTIGLYVGKVFEQVKARPLYVVDESLDEIRARQRELDLAP
jgi:dolichol-phosphate mannosyltransferase